MRMLLLAGAAAMAAAAAPAAAKPNHHGNNNHHGKYGAWGNACPPGLNKKNNGCTPPGQAKRHFRTGQRWVGTSGYRWNYSQVPLTWRQQYDLDQANRYYYRDGYLYSVDPRTRLVEQVIRAIL